MVDIDNSTYSSCTTDKRIVKVYAKGSVLQ